MTYVVRDGEVCIRCDVEFATRCRRYLAWNAEHPIDLGAAGWLEVGEVRHELHYCRKHSSLSSSPSAAGGPVGLASIPFVASQSIAPGDAVTLRATTQGTFRPFKLVVAERSRPFFDVVRCQLATVSLIDLSGPFAAAAYTPQAEPMKREIEARHDLPIEMVVRNTSAAPQPFDAALYGEAPPSADA